MTQSTKEAEKASDEKPDGTAQVVKRTIDVRERHFAAEEKQRAQALRVKALELAIQAHAADRNPNQGQAITQTAGTFETYLKGPVETKPDAPDQP